MQGRRKEATAELMLLESTVRDKGLRLQIIDAALSALDPVRENGRLISLSEEAVGISRHYGRKDLESFFMSRKADFLSTKITFLQYKQRNLKLSPDWTEFSTEQDREEFQKLTQEIKEVNEEIDNLLNSALSIAEQTKSQQNVARILMASASIESARYLQYKTECLGSNFRAKLWLKFPIMRYPILETSFIFPGDQGRTLNKFVDSFTKKFIKATQVLRGVDDSLAGYAYHNLANDLKTAYRFRQAKKYLIRARVVAEKYNDALLKKQVEALGRAIKARNKDIPDYINGETREDIF